MLSVVSINMEVVHEANALEIVLVLKSRMSIRSQCIDGDSNSVVLISALEFVQRIVRAVSTLRSRGGGMLGQRFLHDFQPSPSLGTHTSYLLLPIVVDLPHLTPRPLPTQHRTVPPTPGTHTPTLDFSSQSPTGSKRSLRKINNIRALLISELLSRKTSAYRIRAYVAYSPSCCEASALLWRAECARRDCTWRADERVELRTFSMRTLCTRSSPQNRSPQEKVTECVTSPNVTTAILSYCAFCLSTSHVTISTVFGPVQARLARSSTCDLYLL